MHRRPVGPAAWLLDDVDDPAAWATSLQALRVEGVIEIVPAECTVLVVCDRSEARVVGARLDEVTVVARDRTSTTTVAIDVVYDGADLVSVSDATGLAVDEVIARHSSGLYTVAFCGFSPGFAYMKGLDPALQIPRRDTPRTTVPAGSVAIAGDYTSVYPSASPGGWHLLGTTTMVLWDAAAPQPALLAPGTTVQFRDRPMMSALRVVEAGWSTTVQDLGRLGYAHLGLPRAGAVDPAGRALVTRLVGNTADMAVLETAGGLVVEAVGTLVVATSGEASRHTLQPGDRLRVDPPEGGVWAYLAVRGGIAVESVLGSRSHDTLSGVGPPIIAAGVRLDVGDDPQTELVTDLAPSRPRSPVVRLWPGPRADWFEGGVGALIGHDWTVGRDLSRVGVRLSPGSFRRSAAMPEHMASEGLVDGAVQITPSGEPIVMLANHPTTGGYPVIAVVEPDDIPVVAQARPGATLRFRPA